MSLKLANIYTLHICLEHLQYIGIISLKIEYKDFN